MRKIVLTTIGTLGDLHPFIAIALAMKARGFRPVLAVPEDHVAKVQRAGLEAVAVLPGFDTIRERLGVSESEAVRRMMSDQRYMLEQAVLPSLSACAHTLDALIADADAIVASTMVLAARSSRRSAAFRWCRSCCSRWRWPPRSIRPRRPISG